MSGCTLKYVAQGLACGKLSASIVVMILPGYVLAKLLAPEVSPFLCDHLHSTLCSISVQCFAFPANSKA